MMVSMTAYGREQADGEWGQASCEIRTVNHRYLETSIRLPEELREFEQAVREKVSTRLNRGKVDCIIRYQRATVSMGPLMVDQDLSGRLMEAAEGISARLNNPAAINPFDILAWPGMIKQAPANPNRVGDTILELVERTLNRVVDTRRREGDKIAVMLEQRCAAMSQTIAGVRENLADIMAARGEKLKARANALAQEVDHDRLELELLILAQKYDVAEELDRLEMHMQEVNRIIGRQGPVGRRLDFLMQELNREANTLGAKSADISINQAAMDLKVLIEQMREQIQNIE